MPVPVTVGAPAGKTKTILVDLEGKVPAGARRLRLTEAFEIHWDRIALMEKKANALTKISFITPSEADLHFRGFSRMYRKGGRYGPYWFAYDDVTKESPWRVIDGAFTRFGDVLPYFQLPVKDLFPEAPQTKTE